MSITLVLTVLAVYFAGLLLIAHLTARGGTTSTFFVANRSAPWYVVAFGMIGASLSGVTFISVPGWVGDTSFGYMQMVLGYQVGYAIIGLVLLPLYYKLNLISIYQYLEQRFGFWSYKTGAAFFLLSRTIGAAFRLYLVASVLQVFLFDALGWRFEFTVIITILLIWLYTFRGGIRTVIWTDTLQTTFMLLAVGTTIYLISNALGWDFGMLISNIQESDYANTFFFDNPDSGNYFWKKFLGGAAIALVMTGLDQDMMQKNLTCKTRQDAQKNMFWFSLSLIPVNLIFLALGALLYIYAAKEGIALPEKSDELFPLIVKKHLNTFAGVTFLLGVMAAAYSSADSALTSLTTSYCVDFLGFAKEKKGRVRKRKIRIQVHLVFSVILALVIIIFRQISDESVISEIFTVAGYTYGPLLGLFAFGLFTKAEVRDRFVPVICILSPCTAFLLNIYSEELFNGYKFGFELLIVNGLLTFLGLVLLWRKK
ncbi:MAG: sodium:solute symporter [Bacteroidota bacterium]